MSVTAIKPAYTDEDVAAAVVGWCRPAAFVRHHGQLCEVLSYIDTTDNSVQIRYAGPAKANRATVSTRNTPGAGTAWVAELSPATQPGSVWVWDTSKAEPVFQIADTTGPGQTRPSTAGTLGSRDHRGFDFGPGRIEEEVPEPPRLRLPGKLNIYVGADHPHYDRAVRASSRPPEQEEPPAVAMLKNDDEMSAMAAEAREAQEWLATMRAMLAEDNDEEVHFTAPVLPQFAHDEWGAPIKQFDLMKQHEEQERSYLEQHMGRARRDSMSSTHSGDSAQHQPHGGGRGRAGVPGRPQPNRLNRPSTAESYASTARSSLPPI